MDISEQPDANISWSFLVSPVKTFLGDAASSEMGRRNLGGLCEGWSKKLPTFGKKFA